MWAHNIEVVRRLQRTIRDVRCSYDRSLDVLRRVKSRDPSRWTKSSIMVGIGETFDEVKETMADLREAGVDMVTLGQYLRPSPKHAAVARYVDPQEFLAYEQDGRALGFRYVASGPLVRSSYKAAEGFVRGVLRPGDPDGADRILKERLAEARAAAAKVDGDEAPRTTSELASRAAGVLLSPSSLVRAARRET